MRQPHSVLRLFQILANSQIKTAMQKQAKTDSTVQNTLFSGFFFKCINLPLSEKCQGSAAAVPSVTRFSRFHVRDPFTSERRSFFIKKLFKDSGVKLRTSVQSYATEMMPVSSETTTVTASLVSLMPMAAL